MADLPSARTVRSDAELNRRRILAAAESLFACRGVEQVTMHDVAREAEVGVGTLYRRFGDRAGLALALLDDRERTFQEQLIRGLPPLGPGAPAHERLLAFGPAYLEFVEDHVELLAAAQPPRVTLGGPFDVYRTHVLMLLREAAPAVDVEYAAETLLNALRASLHLELRRNRDWPLERLQDGWRALAAAWLAAGRAE